MQAFPTMFPGKTDEVYSPSNTICEKCKRDVASLKINPDFTPEKIIEERANKRYPLPEFITTCCSSSFRTFL